MTAPASTSMSSSLEQWATDPVAFELDRLRINLRDRHTHAHGTYARRYMHRAARRRVARIRIVQAANPLELS